MAASFCSKPTVSPKQRATVNTRTFLSLLVLCGGCAAPSITECPFEEPATIKVIQNGVWLDTVMEPINLSKSEVNYVVMHWEPRSTINPLFQVVTDTDSFFTTTQNVSQLLDTSYVEDGWVVNLDNAAGFVFVNIYWGPNDLRPCWLNEEKARHVLVLPEVSGTVEGAYVQVGTHTLFVPEGGARWKSE